MTMQNNRRVQYYAAFAVSLASMTTSALYFWPVPILPKFHNNEIIPNITSSEISWMVAMSSPGAVVGSLVCGRVSDQFGRRTTLLTSAIPIIIGTILILCATTAWMIYIARMLWGSGAGMITTVTSIYLSEIADKDIRGTLTAGTRFMFNGGGMLVLVIGSLVSYQVLGFFLTVLPVCYFIACWWIPESPYYLIKEGKFDEAKKEMLRLSGFNDEKLIDEKLSLIRSDVKKEMTRAGSVKELFTGKQYRKAILISIGLRITQLWTGTIPVQQYLGRIIQQSNCGMDVSTAIIIFGAVRFVVGLSSPLVVDKIGRRPLLIHTFFSAGLILAIIGSYFYIQKAIDINNINGDHFSYTVFIGIIAFVIIANIGFDTLIFIIPAEIFPLNVKSIAMTALNIFTAILTFTVVKGYQSMEDYVGLYGVFWFYATMAFSGTLFTYFVVPETKGKTLREIQIELQGNLNDEAEEKLNKVDISEYVEQNTELKYMTKKLTDSYRIGDIVLENKQSS